MFENWPTVVSGCLVWIPVAAIVLMLIGWMIQGDVDVLFGAAGIFCAVFLGFYATDPPTPELGPVFLGATVLTAILIPVARWIGNRAALRKLDLDAATKAYQQLSLHPSDVLARLRLASMLHQRGMTSHAFAVGHDAVVGQSAQAFRDEIRMVESWARMSQFQGPPSGLRCLDCGYSNSASALWCEKCRGELLLDYVCNRTFGAHSLRLILGAWIAIIIGFVAVPISAKMLPRQFVIPAIVAEFALIIFIVVSALVSLFRGRRK